MPSASAVARDPGRYAEITFSPTENLVIDLAQPGLNSRIQLLAKALDRVEKSYQEIGASQHRISVSFSHMSERNKDMFRRIGKITENNCQMRENNRQMREDLDNWHRDMDEFRAYLDLQRQKPKEVIEKLKEIAKKRNRSQKSTAKHHSSPTYKNHSTSSHLPQEAPPSLIARVSNLLLSPVFALFEFIRRTFSDENKKAP
ncbi:MAG: hypothetical protein ACM3JI_03180 [Anaerolineae bacterium]